MPQQNRFRTLSIEIIVLIILIPVAIFLSTKIWNKQAIPNQPILTETPTATNFPTPSITPTTTSQPNKVTATLKPAGKTITLNFQGPKETASYKISVSKKITVIEAMRIAQAQGLILKTKDYGASLGILIEGINNILNDSNNQKYWTLYVNNVRSAVGASTATVEPGDIITWKFENTTL